jgi:hypothetical protein
MGQIVLFEPHRREQLIKRWIPVSPNTSRKSAQQSTPEAVNLEVLQNDLKWHARIGWGAMGVAVVFAGGLLTWYLPKELSSTSSQIRSELGERMARLEDKVDSINSRLQQLQSPLGRVLVGPSEAKTLNPNDLRLTFQKANQIIDASLKEKRPPPTPDLSYETTTVREVLRSVPMKKDIRDAGVSTLARLAAYETLGQLARTNSFQNVFVHVTMANSGTAISAPLEMARLTIVVDSDFRNVGQDITGFKWVLDRFENARISYSGGPLDLSETSFSNCKFQFGSDPVSRKVLDILNESKGRPVSIVVGPNFSSLDLGRSLP